MYARIRSYIHWMKHVLCLPLTICITGVVNYLLWKWEWGQGKMVDLLVIFKVKWASVFWRNLWRWELTMHVMQFAGVYTRNNQCRKGPLFTRLLLKRKICFYRIVRTNTSRTRFSTRTSLALIPNTAKPRWKLSPFWREAMWKEWTSSTRMMPSGCRSKNIWHACWSAKTWRSQAAIKLTAENLFFLEYPCFCSPFHPKRKVILT